MALAPAKKGGSGSSNSALSGPHAITDSLCLYVHTDSMFIAKTWMFKMGKRVLFLEVLIEILLDIYKKCADFHSKLSEMKSSWYLLFFSIIKYAGF